MLGPGIWRSEPRFSRLTSRDGLGSEGRAGGAAQVRGNAATGSSLATASSLPPARQRPLFKPHLVALNDDERAGGRLDPGAAIDVQNAVMFGLQRQMGVTAGHEPEAPARRHTRMPAA